MPESHPPPWLLLDLGNTRTKWAWAAPGGLLARGGFPHADSAPGLAAMAAAGDRPGRVVLASVAAPRVAEALSAWILQRWEAPMERAVATASACGVQNGYRLPGQLGIDRWLAVLAAHAIDPACPWVVVDAGTAVTLDLLAPAGRHLGGAILPGLAAMEAGLFAATRIPPQGLPSAPQFPATATAEGIAAGLRLAVSGAVARAAETLEEMAGRPPQILLTGGDAGHLLPWLGGRVRHEPELVLLGLLRYASAIPETCGESA